MFTAPGLIRSSLKCNLCTLNYVHTHNYTYSYANRLIAQLDFQYRHLQCVTSAFILQFLFKPYNYRLLYLHNSNEVKLTFMSNPLKRLQIRDIKQAPILSVWSRLFPVKNNILQQSRCFHPNCPRLGQREQFGPNFTCGRRVWKL